MKKQLNFENELVLEVGNKRLAARLNKNGFKNFCKLGEVLKFQVIKEKQKERETARIKRISKIK